MIKIQADLKPEEAVMIGGDAPVDILLPKSLGINAILLNREGRNLECSPADAIVNILNEAVETIIRKFVKAETLEGASNV